jgi:replication initiation and membrane attachment protein DnaB
MYLKNKLQTLKMKEGDNMTKHIHKFTSLLEQLSLVRTLVSNDEAMFSLLKSMPMSYKKIISSFKQQPNLIVQALITNILQEKIMMQNLNYALNFF